MMSQTGLDRLTIDNKIDSAFKMSLAEICQVPSLSSGIRIGLNVHCAFRSFVRSFLLSFSVHITHRKILTCASRKFPNNSLELGLIINFHYFGIGKYSAFQSRIISSFLNLAIFSMYLFRTSNIFSMFQTSKIFQVQFFIVCDVLICK